LKESPKSIADEMCEEHWRRVLGKWEWVERRETSRCFAAKLVFAKAQPILRMALKICTKSFQPKRVEKRDARRPFGQPS
jgi:hypothetical protein